MGNSPLATYTNISPNKTSPRNHTIDTITIHCVVGQLSAKRVCDYFTDPSLKASCNYAVGNDGSIGLCVDEGDRSWCSSSASNDHRAITIEVASDTYHPYAVTDKAYQALIDLVTDVCKRNGIKKLLWRGDKSLIGQVDKQNMTVHRWFANKACPGDYLYSRHSDIANQVNARLGATSDTSDSKKIWDYFMEKIGNEYGVAGLMGNLEAESGLHPDRVQGDIPYSSYSKEYTAKVDNGTVSEYDFVHNGPGGGGYGLAQWTFYTRKQALYDMYKSGGYSSIGSLDLAMDYLWYELSTGYTGVLSTLKTATSVRVASDKVLHDFERPADQSTAVEEKRSSMCQAWYDKYAGSTPGGGEDPDEPVIPDPEPNPVPATRKKMSLLLMATAIRRRG